MENFTPLSATLGGLMTGASAVFLMFSLGRIAGVSGIIGGLFSQFYKPDTHANKSNVAGGHPWHWQLTFVAGIIAAPLLVKLFSQTAPVVEIDAGYPLLIIAGLMVGYGTLRSIVAVGIFMVVAILTVMLSKIVSGA